MSKYQAVGVRAETDEEKARAAWLAQQQLASPANLEDAARLLIGLVTGLFTLLFGVLALNTEPGKLPIYLAQTWFRWASAAGIVALLVALVAGLVVVFPRARLYNPNSPGEATAVFAAILGDKSKALTVAVVAFGIGIVLLGIVLVAAVLMTPMP